MSIQFSQVLANKLKSLRKSVDMTQDDVALLLGMNRTSFSKYENGAANPPLSVLRKLAKLYAVPIEYLIHDDVSQNIVQSSDSDELPENFDIKDISIFFSKLSQEERMIILKIRLLNQEDKEDIIRRINDSFENGV